MINNCNAVHIAIDTQGEKGYAQLVVDTVPYMQGWSVCPNVGNAIGTGGRFFIFNLEAKSF